MPKPIFGINGSGMHTHQSLYSIAEGRNAFADITAPYGLSDLAKSYMAGILAHARGMIAVLAPLVNSYKRLVPGYEAPTYITWGRTNRSALIRVPMISPGKSIEGTRCEVRCPDPSSNTYLAFAVMIAAGLDGVEKGLVLHDPVEESLFEMDAARIAEKGIKELPGTLGEAIDELEKDSVITEALGDHVLSHYVSAKRPRGRVPTQVTGWELTATSRRSSRFSSSSQRPRGIRPGAASRSGPTRRCGLAYMRTTHRGTLLPAVERRGHRPASAGMRDTHPTALERGSRPLGERLQGQVAHKRRLLNVVRMKQRDRQSTPRRATAARRRGTARAACVARRIGTGLREARLALDRRQVDVALAAGITQPHYSRMSAASSPA
jgi:hypothetical protein